MTNCSGYIYKTSNRLNGKVYIGQHKGNFDPYYFGSGHYISRAVKHYGKKYFKVEVLIYAKSKKELDALERRYISQFKKRMPKKLYNLAEGGCGGSHGNLNTSKKLSVRKKIARSVKAYFKKHPEQKIAISERQKTYYADPENNPMWGRHQSASAKKKISLANTGPNLKLRGIKRSEKTLRKLRIASRLRWSKGCPEEARRNIRLAHLGKKLSKAHRQAISKGWRSQSASESRLARKNMRLARLGKHLSLGTHGKLI